MYKKKRRLNKVVIPWMAVWLSALVSMAIIIPGLIVQKINKDPSNSYQTPINNSGSVIVEQTISVPVYLSQKKQVETVPLEQYVRGVLAAEMPVDFELEALKAQAMAARTYIVRRIMERDFSNVPVKEAWVTDTITHQAYINSEDLKTKWSSTTYAANMEKINRAVKETQDQILLYENQPINATFFSTSNGFTENSEDYWPDQIPYLRSVPSPWDAKLSPRFQETVTLAYKTVLQKLGVSSISTISTKPSGIRVLERSVGRRIKKISIGGQTFSGREIREKLGLASSEFDWKWKGTELEFTTYGYGHGVGLSQWGANGMAKEGKTAEEIVTHYYTDISIGKASAILPKN
jgi:stage II sporulation protein D